MQIKLPEYISLIINTLKSNGFEAFIVGGCVRDALLNKVPNDWDICTSALPEQTLDIFKKYRLITSGIKHGTVCVIINHSPVEITTFRIDGDYKDSRRPENVTFTPKLEEDLSRRDFTVNSMAYSDETGLVDLNGGTNDLISRTIRCVGTPETRFKEDALRIMRALRFSGQLGFNIEEETKKAVFSQKMLLKNISAERITDEFLKLIASDNYQSILCEYEDVIKVFLPCFNADFPKFNLCDDLRLRLSQIFLTSKCESDKVFGILKLPKKLRYQVLTIIEKSSIKIPADKFEIKKSLSVLGEEMLNLIFTFKDKHFENISEQKRLSEEIVKNNECYSLKQLNISGNDIIKLGIDDNKNIGIILQYLLEAVMSGDVINENELLRIKAKEYIKGM